MHCRCGVALPWCGAGWDPGAPRANGGLGLDAPIATNNGAPIVRRIREEFISGTRGGELTQFRLTYEAATRDDATLTVRRTQTAPRHPVAFEFADARTVRLTQGAPEPGSIYELRYNATNPRVLGIGFAATRDIVSHLRNSADGRDLLGRQPTHALAFGISQAGRYLRDHLAQGFNRDETGARVFDGVFTHVAGIGRVFFNTEFGQPGRTRTWHEDHDFPEIEYPFATAELLRGDDTKVIETNTSTEYWQKGASLLHTDGTRDVACPRTCAATISPARSTAARPACRVIPAHASIRATGMIRCRRSARCWWRWMSGWRTAASRRHRACRASTMARWCGQRRWRGQRSRGWCRRRRRMTWWRWTTGPVRRRPCRRGRRWCRRWMPTATRSGACGCPISRCRRGCSRGGTYTGRPCRRGELADRDGTYLAFGEPRYPSKEAYVARVREVVGALQAERLLLEDDAAPYLERARL